MNPVLALLLEAAVKYAPVLAIELAQTLSKDKVTDADWDALKAKYYGKTYEQYISEAPPCKPA